MSPEILTLQDSLLYCIFVLSLVGGCAFFLKSKNFIDRLAFGSVIIVMLLGYIWHRIFWTLPELEFTAYAIWPRIYLFLELIVLSYTLLSIVFFMRRTDRSAEADAGERRLQERGEYPAVDVMICTYNEELGILERSILAALAIDYPNFTVWVLDDGKRDWLRAYCERVGAQYIRRTDNKGAKAGNVDNGLEHTKRITNAPFFLLLDADFAPRKSILKRTVGLFDDDSVGLVQTPQFYYNSDPIQHNLLASGSWVDDQRIFFDVMQPSKDAWGAAFCVGTSFVARRAAIEEIGGMPKESVTEDLHTTYRLLLKGVRTIWLNERLSIGLSAESLSGYITQRCRWCLGTIQIALLKDGPFRGAGYSFIERLHYMHGLLFWLCRPFILALMLAPIFYYFLGLPAILLEPEALLVIGLPAVGGSMIFHAWISGRRSLPIFTEVTHLLTAVPVTITIVNAIRKPFGHPFKVTAKGEDRSEVQVQYSMAAMYLAIIVLTLIGMFNGPLLRTTGSIDGFSIAWGTVVMLHSFIAFLVCVELPRAELDDEHFPVSSPIWVRIEGKVLEAKSSSMSLNEIVFERGSLDLDLKPDQKLEMAFLGGLAARASVMTQNASHVRVRLRETEAIRDQIVARLFSDPPANIAEQGSMLRTAFALVRRMVGGIAGAPKNVHVKV
ncbi:glycosyltransferase [Roseibium marinum]|uniref:Cellulose synthase (UDP-forming) n=1 Tax=Roseibium marinum TaxID=281252 RepID=A0A2S3US26_9HYPH|nr:cellulose synthase catalytic subunit [Roseibium marinum]POF30464.1 cellulose synthase (UDP-forming) [Roseibium marinum]